MFSCSQELTLGRGVQTTGGREGMSAFILYTFTCIFASFTTCTVRLLLPSIVSVARRAVRARLEWTGCV